MLITPVLTTINGRTLPVLLKTRNLQLVTYRIYPLRGHQMLYQASVSFKTLYPEKISVSSSIIEEALVDRDRDEFLNYLYSNEILETEKVIYDDVTGRVIDPKILELLKKSRDSAFESPEIPDKYDPGVLITTNPKSLNFLGRFRALRLSEASTTRELKRNLKVVESILRDFSSINSKGYVNSVNLLCLENSIGICSASLLKLSNNRKVPASELKHWDSTLSIDSKEELLKWTFNLINLKLYEILLQGSQKLVSLAKEQYLDPEKLLKVKDLLQDYNVLSAEVFGKLDPSIRVNLLAPGITITQNIYLGFDTEYQHMETHNELLSSQLAVSTKTLLKLTDRSLPYEFSKASVLGNEVFPTKERTPDLAYERILWEIRDSIKYLRGLKGGGNDEAVTTLIMGLRKAELPFHTKEGSIVFDFGRTVIKEWINYSSSQTLAGLIYQALKMSHDDLGNELKRIKIMLKDIADDDGWEPADISMDEQITPSSILKIGNENNLKSATLLSKELYSDTTLVEEEEEERLEALIGRSLKKFVRSEESLKTMEFNTYHKKFMTMNGTGWTSYESFTPEKINVSLKKNVYLIAHHSSADLSMIKDFEQFKDLLTIVNSTFVTLKPIKIFGVNLHIRDTKLLAPPGFQALKSLGSLYGESFGKIALPEGAISNMKTFLVEDPKLFEEYALRDSLITVVHACFMEDMNFKLGRDGIPLTLSQMSTAYVLNYWEKESYKGYQLNQNYLVGDTTESLTPKGLGVLGLTGLKLPYFISNFKGGRNECFMFGIDETKQWFDYDLISAYTTGMCMLDHPDYSKGVNVNLEDFCKWSFDDILYSYTIIKGTFKFPKNTKYPSIPVKTDENSTIYPLEGDCLLTGAELLCAYNQGCQIWMTEVFSIPFHLYQKDKKSKTKREVVKISELLNKDLLQTYTLDDFNTDLPIEEALLISKTLKFKKVKKKVGVTVIKPFEGIIHYFWNERSKHSKGSLTNILYKLFANNFYGNVSTGISNKKKYSVGSRNMERVTPSLLSNPLMASWTTSFIRSVIGELLHSVQLLGGVVVSVTTDGFLTDVDELEWKVENLFSDRTVYQKLMVGIVDTDPDSKSKALNEGVLFLPEVSNSECFSLLREFRKTRFNYLTWGKNLEDDSLEDATLVLADVQALEMRKTGVGLLSWTTRGLIGKDQWVSAVTGFQMPFRRDNYELFKEAFKGEKTLPYVTNRLVSANKIAKKGGHVLMEHNDHQYRLHYDNRRIIKDFDDTGDNKLQDSDPVRFTLQDSDPVRFAEQAGFMRSLSKLVKIKKYHKNTSLPNALGKYKNSNDVCIRSFVKALFCESLNVTHQGFKNYEEIREYLVTFDESINMTRNAIALLKRRCVDKAFTKHQVVKNDYSKRFVVYTKGKFPEFNESDFYK